MHTNTGLTDHTMATSAFVTNSLIAQSVLGQPQPQQQQQPQPQVTQQQQQQQQLHSQMMGGPASGPSVSQQGQMTNAVPGNNGGQQQQQQIPPPGTEGTQQFCLRWNSYPATVATQLAALRAAEDFVDVTLACDGRQLRAHKLVLSACSPYFMQLFKSTPCQHPVIFLRDVGFRQLVALLEFMYAGEVNVSQVELPALLRTAEALQVRGLADTTANNNNNIPPQCPQPQPQHKPSAPQPAPFYGQMISQSVMNPNNANSSPSLAEPIGPSSIVTSQPPPHSTADVLHQLQNPSAPLISSSNVVNNSIAIPCSSSSSSSSNSGGILPSTSNNNNSIVPTLKQELTPGSMPSEIGNGENINAKDDDEDDEDSNDENDFDMTDDTKGDIYTGEDGDISGQLEDTGEVFPDDPNVNFNLGDSVLPGDGVDMDGTGIENQSDEEDSEEESDNDDGECNEFTYQSDASYSQEGMGEPGSVNPNGEGNVPGPSGLGLNKDPLAMNDGGPGTSGGELGKATGSGGSGRNRLSRSLWPPGIPYHGPQQCPYCPRILSNVGNWRKHVLTMHFAREKVHKCIHCASAFRTPEYLQKHYVRVHNYPQKMTRRKYVEQTMKGETH